ncbi:MAG: site-specific integrase [Pseudomonadota bacterium]
MHSIRRFEENMTLRGLSAKTRESYLRFARHFEQFRSHRPRAPHAQHVREFLLDARDRRKHASSTICVAYSALQRYTEWGLEREWAVDFERPVRQRGRLPVVLSPVQVRNLLAAAPSLKYRVALMATYSAGLRASETVGLQVADIDSEQMRLFVRDGKGGKDRYVMLSTTLLHELRTYWKVHRPSTWLFPAATSKPDAPHPMSKDVLGRAFRQARDRAGIRAKASLHSLRHSFATHLLEAGESLPKIQRLLGHSSIKTTMIYLKVANVEEVASPLDRITGVELH